MNSNNATNNFYIRKNKGIRISKIGLLFLAILSVAFMHQSGLLPMYYLTAILVSAFMAIYGALSYIHSRNRNKTEYIFQVGKLLLVPWFLFIIYNFFLYLTHNGEILFIKSSFIQIMFTPIIIMGALGFFYTFKKNALKYFVYAIIVHYIFLIIIQLVDMGLGNFVSGVLTVFQGNSIGNPFETNSDLVLSLGFLVIYYCDHFIKIKDKNNRHALLMLILIILGGKRISFVALILISAFFIFSNQLSYRRKVKIEMILSVIVILGAFLYVYLIDSGIFSTFVWSRGINTMGRVKMYDYVAQFMDMKPTYLGKGYSFANLLLEQEQVLTFQNHVYGLHSDVLKMYVEMGFMVFLFWMVYNLIHLPQKITSKYGNKVGSLFWFLTIYLFSTYFTDNTINYFITQSLYVILILHSIYLSIQTEPIKIGD